MAVQIIATDPITTALQLQVFILRSSFHARPDFSQDIEHSFIVVVDHMAANRNGLGIDWREIKQAFRKVSIFGGADSNKEP